jgi:hypothetical protein
MMEKKSPGKCPPLRMIYTSPRISLDDRHISSKVYAIEYERKNAKDVIRKLKDTFVGSTQFLMAKLRFTHPQSFANALKMQNQIMKDMFVLPLINVTPDEMFYLQPLIEQLPGVITIVPTRLTPTSGRYNILIPPGKFKEVKSNIVKKNWLFIIRLPMMLDKTQTLYDLWVLPESKWQLTTQTNPVAQFPS